MCRSGHEIYDLAWSPDAVFFIIGSMDNVAQIYNAQTGMTFRFRSHLMLTFCRPDGSADS